ncbi:putative permease [Halanaerobium saccharolyticum]|uniref:Putative permease n=1 Tax=Halanaerobium saccharolyticum TaxID=43595 RepID=A0A4R7YYZ5_9FIRM|nr:permease [Halanaerobium saccharolyticum]RAK08488.1 putative permease [Halanaerobium saccharolyticum]TDW03477.1 putative permease [Halanaerobium saccharolyticum]TDX59980.1 putative permease [Halanaerobium saccharolyticum]
MAVFINLTALAALLISIFFSQTKTKQGIKKALIKALGLAPQMLIIITAIGLVFAFLPPELIRSYLGGELDLFQLLFSAFFGALMMIPSLIALPLAGSLIEAGASYTPVAAFITTLTMVGFVTLPVEIKELGKKITFYRNCLAFVFAVIISLLIGVIM